MDLPTTTFKFILHFIRQQKVKFLLCGVTGIIWTINETFFPYFIKMIVNKLQEKHAGFINILHAVQKPLILLIAFWCLSEICIRSQGIVQIYLFPQFRANIRKDVFKYVQSHSYEYFSNNFAGNISKRLADLPNSCQTIVEIVFLNFISASTGACIILFMMWLTQPLFAVALCIWLILHLTLTGLFLKVGNQLWEVHSEAVSELSGKIVDIFTNILNVRLFSCAKYEEKYLKKFQRDELKKAQKSMWVLEISRFGLGLNGLSLVFGMTFLLLYSWSKHWITLGDFTQVEMQTFWLFGWIWFISYQIQVFARELGSINDALNLVRQSHDVADIKNAKTLKITNGQIRFNDVTFGYQKQEPIFKNLNLEIIPGQRVGLVGFSGAGKSTFVNLILRFYDIQSGYIYIDGQNIAEVTQDSLRANIAVIPQEPMLFHRTLMDNIRYGRIDATNEEVIAAAKLADCHKFIECLDEGYESLVGERGIKLSGGQRQRIAIARAILKNAPILILDEATSALDSVTEKQIQENLHELMQNRTTIVIAHRLSTLADMNRILVFEKGQIIEEGTKDELIKANGHFTKLWNMQINGFLPN